MSDRDEYETKTMSTPPTCKTCKYLKPIDTEEKQGLCSRYPPSVFPVGPNQTLSLFPTVREAFLCGEYKTEIIEVAELDWIV